jgi:hypothetical protein
MEPEPQSLLVVTLFLAIGACSRHAALEPSSPHRITVACEIDGGAPFVRVKVDGSGPLRFLIDSGSAYTILDTHCAERLGIRTIADAGSLQGAGEGRVTYARAARPVVVDFGGIRQELDPIVLGLGGESLDGVVGYDFLTRFDVTIDYARGMATIADPGTSDPPGPGHPLDIDFDGKWPRVHGRITVPGNAPIDDLFVVDSGSGDAVDHPLIEKSTEPLQEVTTGVGLGQPKKGHLGRIESLVLAGYRIGRAPSACCSGSPRDDRVIGGEVLRRFTVTFDYPSKRIYFEPNARFDDRF